MLVAVITYQFDRLIFVHGTTSNFPSVGLRFRERRVTLSRMQLSTEVSHGPISLAKETPRDQRNFTTAT